MTHLERLAIAGFAIENWDCAGERSRESYLLVASSILTELRTIATEPDVVGHIVDTVFDGGIEDASIISDIINSALDRIIGDERR